MLRKCPVCGSVLKRVGKSGYECPNSDCDVIRVQFSRTGKVKRIVKRGIEDMGSFGHK